jgi:hypothetical protein
MSSSCGSSKNIYQEAIDHCRWKEALKKKVLTLPEFQKNNLIYFSSMSFGDIFTFVYNKCKNIKGVGILSIYDITSTICRYININIDKVYIIGSGPRRAIKLLGVKPKLHKIAKNISLKYVEITEIVEAFHKNNYELDIKIKNSNNGDHFESYICNWQKKI